MGVFGEINQIDHNTASLPAIAQQLHLVADALAGAVASGAGSSGAGGTLAGLVIAAQPRPSIPLPISPTTLAQSLIAAREPGISALIFARDAVTVPAGGSYTVTFPVEPGNTMVFAAPVRIYADTHDAGITGTLVVDETDVLFENFPFTADVSDPGEEMPQYGNVKESVVATFYNATSSPVVMTYDFQVVLVANDDYNGTWAPFLEYGYAALKGFVSALTAAGGV